MLVLDASAVVELALRTPLGRTIGARIFDPDDALHAPHLIDVEVVHTLRRGVRLRAIEIAEAAEALDFFRDLDLERHPHGPLLHRMWSLRDNLTAYDAVYVALSESLDATLLTCDEKLARALPRGSRVDVELVR